MSLIGITLSDISDVVAHPYILTWMLAQELSELSTRPLHGKGIGDVSLLMLSFATG